MDRKYPIKSGLGEEIVPELLMNYDMSTSQFADKTGLSESSDHIPWATMTKFQGKPSDRPMKGEGNWNSIAKLLEKYCHRRGITGKQLVFVDWTSYGVDQLGVREHLRDIQKETILPTSLVKENACTQFNPLSWWRNVRKAAGPAAKGFSLRLGNLYSTLFLDRRATLANSHSAEADVNMLIAVTRAYIDLRQGRPISERLEAHFKQNPDDTSIFSKVYRDNSGGNFEDEHEIDKVTDATLRSVSDAARKEYDQYEWYNNATLLSMLYKRNEILEQAGKPIMSIGLTREDWIACLEEYDAEQQ